MSKLFIRLILALYNRFKKAEQKEQFEILKSGALQNSGPPLRPYVQTIYDEEREFPILIQYVCACGAIDFIAGTGFACAHCDSVCRKKECELCTVLKTVDYYDEEE